MEKDTTRYIFRTKYFYKDWTWTRRAFAIAILDIGVFLIPLDDSLFFVRLILIALITLYIIAKPKDDLGVDEEYLYHFKTSIIKAFTRVDKYKLSSLYSIRCGGIHNDKWELIDFFNVGGNMGGHSNLLEMIFNDDSSKSLELAISRTHLDKIVEIARENMDKTKPNNT